MIINNMTPQNLKGLQGKKGYPLVKDTLLEMSSGRLHIVDFRAEPAKVFLDILEKEAPENEKKPIKSLKESFLKNTDTENNLKSARVMIHETLSHL